MVSTPGRAAALLAAFAVSAPAQTTHVVGPGGFPDIGSALTAATHGDVIVVLPGAYPGILMSIGVTIRAAVPGTVFIGGLLNSLAAPLGQQTHLVGLTFVGLTFLSGAGRLTCDTCEFTGRGEIVAIQNTTVHLQNATVSSLPITVPAPVTATLRATNSTVTVIDSFITGTNGTVALPTSAIILVDSVLHASGCTFPAGQGLPAAAAIAANAASTIWLSDSSLTSDVATCPIVAPGAAGGQARTTLFPSCGAMPAAPLLGLSRPQPLGNGQPFAMDFTAAPGTLIGVFASTGLGEFQNPAFAQSVLLAPTGWAAALLVTPATGIAAVNWNIVASPALVDKSVWLQGFAATALPLQASPIAGGVIR